MLRAGELAGRDHVKPLMHAEGIQGAKPWRTTTPVGGAGFEPATSCL
jgi:hypothetical protein